MESQSVDALGELAVVKRSPSFDDFYRAQFPKLVPLARALCGPAIADDIAQEAMLATYRQWRKVGDLASPEAWARRTCANLAVSAFRRRVIEARALVRLGRSAPVGELSPDAEAFWSAVRSLPKRQAQAAALRYLYDLSVAEVAETLGISLRAAERHWTWAKAWLFQWIREQERK